MKFSVLNENLRPIVQRLLKIARGVKSVPVLFNQAMFIVENSRLWVISTNLELAAAMYAGVRADVEGRALVNIDTLSQFLKTLPDERIDFDLIPGFAGEYQVVDCHNCKGTGSARDCWRCHGTGKYTPQNLECPECNGTGKTKCGHCMGSGKETKTIKPLVHPKLNVVCGKRRITIPLSQSIDDYPNTFIEPSKLELPQNGIFVPAEQFSTMLNRVLPAAAKEDNRPILTGVLFEAMPDSNILTFAAADGYRLHVGELELDAPQAVETKSIVPAASLDWLLDTLPKSKKNIYRDDSLYFATRSDFGVNRMYFQHSNFTVSINLIDGKFPDYRQIIPQNTPDTIQVFCSELASAIKSVEMYAKQAANTTKFVAKPNNPVGTLTVNASDYDLGSGETDIDAAVGTDIESGIEMSLNYVFVLEALAAIDTDQVVLSTVGRIQQPISSPVVITPAGHNGFKVVLMPMSVSR